MTCDCHESGAIWCSLCGLVESRVDKADRRKQLRCSYCRPNRDENAKRRPRQKKRKDRAPA